MKKQTLHTDIIIFGGGVAGLWLLNRISTAGYSALLFETDALGCRQTLASQGMVHGGIKYALGGTLSGASETIGAMPQRWRECLAGNDPVDLTRVRVLSDDFYMWSRSSFTSKFTAFAASKALRGRIARLDADEWPDIFLNPQFSGHVYRLHDPVLDTTSLVEELAAPWRKRIFNIDWQDASFDKDASTGRLQGLRLPTADVEFYLSARLFIAAAGAGNAEIIAGTGATQPQMQRRPLHQIALTQPDLPAFYAHALGHKATPRVTISTHYFGDRQPVWYLGGDLATDGVERNPQQQIDFAQQELAHLLPWLDLRAATWRSFRVDRAEPKQTRLVKPDDAYAELAAGCDNLLVCWPTKLTLAPRLGDIVIKRLQDAGVTPGTSDEGTAHELQDVVPGAPLAPSIWEQLFA